MSEFSGSNGKSKLIPPEKPPCRELVSFKEVDFWKGFCFGGVFTSGLILLTMLIFN